MSTDEDLLPLAAEYDRGYAAAKRFYGDAPRIALAKIEKALRELLVDHPPGALVQERIDCIIALTKEQK